MPTADRVQRVAMALTAIAGGDPHADRVSLILAPPLLRCVDQLDAYPEFIRYLEAEGRGPSGGSVC